MEKFGLGLASAGGGGGRSGELVFFLVESGMQQPMFVRCCSVGDKILSNSELGPIPIAWNQFILEY